MRPSNITNGRTLRLAYDSNYDIVSLFSYLLSVVKIRTQESTANLIDEEYKLFHQADTNNLTSSSKFADSCVLT